MTRKEYVRRFHCFPIIAENRAVLLTDNTVQYHISDAFRGALFYCLTLFIFRLLGFPTYLLTFKTKYVYIVFGQNLLSLVVLCHAAGGGGSGGGGVGVGGGGVECVM